MPPNSKLGQAQYSGLLYEHGGFVDDILVHKVADDHFFLCVNASNQEKDFEHIRCGEPLRCRGGVRQRPVRADRHPGTEGLATLQKLDADGPRGHQILLVRRRESIGASARIARTGYTGRGRLRNLRRARRRAERSGTRSCEAGEEFGIKPCGLGARNTLRLEAKMALYGHEIDASITPFEADLAWIVKMDKGEFIGREALAEAKAEGRHAQAGRIRNARPRHRPRRLRSLHRRQAGRLGDQRRPVSHAEQEHRTVLSAGRAGASRDAPIQIMIRNQPVDAVTVPTPFYKRAK